MSPNMNTRIKRKECEYPRTEDTVCSWPNNTWHHPKVQRSGCHHAQSRRFGSRSAAELNFTHLKHRFVGQSVPGRGSLLRSKQRWDVLFKGSNKTGEWTLWRTGGWESSNEAESKTCKSVCFCSETGRRPASSGMLQFGQNILIAPWCLAAV